MHANYDAFGTAICPSVCVQDILQHNALAARHNESTTSAHTVVILLSFINAAPEMLRKAKIIDMTTRYCQLTLTVLLSCRNEYVLINQWYLISEER